MNSVCLGLLYFCVMVYSNGMLKLDHPVSCSPTQVVVNLFYFKVIHYMYKHCITTVMTCLYNIC